MRLESLPTRQLIEGCIRGDSAGHWEEFVRRTRPAVSVMIYRVARRWGEVRSESHQDLIQESYLHLLEDDCKVLRRLVLLDDDCAVLACLKVIAANVCHDYLRGEHAAKRGADVTHSIAQDAYHEVVKEETGKWNIAEREVLLREVDECLEKAARERYTERQKAIFWLYYRQGMTAAAIAAIPSMDLSTKGVESLILRLTRAVRICLQE